MTSLLLAAWLLAEGGGAQPGSAVITGRILSSDGSPMSGVRVAAVPVEGTGRDKSVETFASIAETDSRGQYRLDNLDAGRYFIRAGIVELPTYYPGVTSLSEARAVTVDRNSSAADIDFKTKQTVGVKVSGRVVLDPRMADLMARIKVVLNRAAPAVAEVPVNPDGSFEFRRVAPGTQYSVVVRGLGGVRNITVADRDVTDIVVTIPYRIEIKARLVVEEGPPPANPTALYFRGQSNVSAAILFPPNGNGTAAVLLAEDHHNVIASAAPNGYVIKSVKYGSIDVLEEGLTVPPKDPGEIVVTLGIAK